MTTEQRPGAALIFRDSDLQRANDLELARTLFSNNGHERSTEEVSWIYATSGGKNPHAALAIAEGDVAAGMYVAVPAHFTIQNTRILAAQSLDTMVDANFRGIGLFTKLADRAYEEMMSSGVGLVYGFPNGNSFHGFVKRLGWTALDPVPFLFRPLRTGFLLEKIGGKLASWLDLPLVVLGKGGSERVEALPASGELNILWESFSSQLTVARVRDAEFFQRRFARHPRTSYRYRIVRDGGVLRGLAIFTIENKHGGRVGYLMELMTLPGDQQAATSLVADVLSDMRDEECDGCLAWSLPHSPCHSSYRLNGFLPIPERARPIELHFGFRTLADDSLRSLLSQRESWYLSYSDSDTV